MKNNQYIKEYQKIIILLNLIYEIYIYLLNYNINIKFKNKIKNFYFNFYFKINKNRILKSTLIKNKKYENNNFFYKLIIKYFLIFYYPLDETKILLYNLFSFSLFDFNILTKEFYIETNIEIINILNKFNIETYDEKINEIDIEFKNFLIKLLDELLENRQVAGYFNKNILFLFNNKYLLLNDIKESKNLKKFFNKNKIILI